MVSRVIRYYDRKSGVDLQMSCSVLLMMLAVLIVSGVAHAESIAPPEDFFGTPISVSVAPDGHLYVFDSWRRMVHAYVERNGLYDYDKCVYRSSVEQPPNEVSPGGYVAGLPNGGVAVALREFDNYKLIVLKLENGCYEVKNEWSLSYPARGIGVSPEGDIWVVTSKENIHGEITGGASEVIYKARWSENTKSVQVPEVVPVGYGVLRSTYVDTFWPAGGWVSGDGHFLFADRDNGRVLELDGERFVKEYSGFQMPIDVTGYDEYLVVLDFAGIHLLTSEIHLFYRDIHLKWPMSIDIDRNGSVIIADFGNHQVKVLRFDEVLKRSEPISVCERNWVWAGALDRRVLFGQFAGEYWHRKSEVTVPSCDGKPLVKCSVISNDYTRVEVLYDGAYATGFALFERRSDSVRAICRTEFDRWRAGNVKIWKDDSEEHILFSGFVSSPSEVNRLKKESFIHIVLKEHEPFPQVSFSLDIESISKPPSGEYGVVEPYTMFRTYVSDSSIIYQGGFLQPLPHRDSYVASKENVPPRSYPLPWWWNKWSHVLYMNSTPIPAYGLWDPDEGVFVAYDYAESRGVDYSTYDLGVWAEATDPDESSFSIVYPGAYSDGKAACRIEGIPAKLSSSFRLLYWTDMFDGTMPNERIMSYLVSEYGESMRSVPSGIDVGWLPPMTRKYNNGSLWLLEHEFGDSIYDPARSGIWEYIPDGAQANFRLNALMAEVSASSRLREMLKMRSQDYMGAVEFFEVNGEECAAWKMRTHPDEPESATFHSGTDNWVRGFFLLGDYIYNGNEEVLPVLDGLVKWAKHENYNYGGIAVDPASHFVFKAGVGADFLLTYYHTFKNDEKRSGLARQALQQARMAVYSGMFIYLDDPDPYDRRSPEGMIQPINTPNWFGTVSLAETGFVWPSVFQVYVETGDPILEYIINLHWNTAYIGLTDRLDTTTVENIWGGAAGRHWGAKGGVWDSTASTLLGRVYAEPVGTAVVRVVMGRESAIAFGKGTRTAQVAEYGFSEPTSFAMRLKVDDAEVPFDVILTTPQRCISGVSVCINGTKVDEDRLMRSMLGEDVLIKGICSGDVITLGDEDVKLSTIERLRPTLRDTVMPSRFTLVDLEDYFNASPPRDWDRTATYAGIVRGVRYSGGVPYNIALEGAWAIVLSLDWTTINLTTPTFGKGLYIFGSEQSTPRKNPLEVKVVYEDGTEATLKLQYVGIADVSWPLGRGLVQTYRAELQPARAVSRVQLKGDFSVFAMTLFR